MLGYNSIFLHVHQNHLGFLLKCTFPLPCPPQIINGERGADLRWPNRGNSGSSFHFLLEIILRSAILAACSANWVLYQICPEEFNVNFHLDFLEKDWAYLYN